MSLHTAYKILGPDLVSCGMPLPDHGGPERLGGYQFAIGELTEAVIRGPRLHAAPADGFTYNGIQYDRGELVPITEAKPYGITAYDDADGYAVERDGVQLLSSNVFVSVEFDDDDLISFRLYGNKVAPDAFGVPVARTQVSLARCTLVEIIAGPYA